MTAFIFQKLKLHVFFQSVLADDHGLYTCFCKHLDGNSFKQDSVQLVVKQDWEELYETDHAVRHK